MFLVRICAVLGFVMMLVASQTQARELQLSVDARVGGDSNILRSRDNGEADGFFELSPKVGVADENESLNYNFNYQPTWETLFDNSDVNGFDHRVNGDALWRVTPVDAVGVESSYLDSRRFRFEAAADPLAAPDINDRERLRRSEARVYYQRIVNAVTSVQTGFSFDDYDYSRNRSFDSRSYTGDVSGQYQVNPQLSVGLSMTGRRRESRPVSDNNFVSILTRVASNTRLFSPAFSLSYDFSPSLSSSIQVGPSFINTQEQPDSVQRQVTLPNGDPAIPYTNKDDVTVFVTGTTEKRWQNTDASISYIRSEAPGGNNSSSSISDQILLRVAHRVSRSTNVRAEGSWSLRQQIVDLPGQDDRQTTRYRVVATATHKLTRHWTVVGQYSYQNQDEDVDTPPAVNNQALQLNTYDSHSGFLSLRYTFDPVVF